MDQGRPPGTGHSPPSSTLPPPLQALARDLPLAVEPARFLAILEEGGPAAPIAPGRIMK